MTDTLIQRLSDEADLCRNDGATDVAKLIDDAVYALVNQAARLAAAELVSAQPAAPAVCSSCDGTGKISGLPCAWCMQSAAPAEQEISAEEKFCDGHCSWAEHHPDCSLAAPPAQPIAHLWQHGETGRTRIVMPDQIFTADANWLLVGPMYLHPAAAPADAAPSVAPEPVAWRYQDARGHYRYRAYKPGFDVEYAILKPVPLYEAHPPRAPLTEEQKRDLVKECDLDWQRGFMLLFDDDPTNRYAVLIEAVEAAHGIGGK